MIHEQAKIMNNAVFTRREKRTVWTGNGSKQPSLFRVVADLKSGRFFAGGGWILFLGGRIAVKSIEYRFPGGFALVTLCKK
jgi:hypothetical protein